MILGVLLARKKYPIAKYFCVLMIVSGVASFMYNNKKSEKASDHGFGYGELLLVRLSRFMRYYSTVSNTILITDSITHT